MRRRPHRPRHRHPARRRPAPRSVSKALFLPGAGGRRSFWQPVARQLDPRIECEVLAWPGFGDEPRDDSIEDLGGLAAYVLQRMGEPCDLVAQSMGGVIALSLALEHPDL